MNYRTLAYIAMSVLFASTAHAQDAQVPQWVKNLQFVDKPALEVTKGSLSTSAKARITIKNTGPEASQKIRIECTAYDQAGNAVGLLIGDIGRIQPGRLGIEDARTSVISDMARDIDCEIVPSPWTRSW